MNHSEHARTGTHAVGRRIQAATSLRRGDNGSLTPAPAELVIVDLIAQHDKQPDEQLPGDGDFGFRAPAPMHEGEGSPPEVGIHAGCMRGGLPEGEAQERAACLVMWPR